MYYRVAIQVHSSPAWRWKSTALSSLNILLQWLQFYRALPQDRLHIFSSPSREALNEQLLREDQGLGSASVPATQFLQERRITPREVMRETSADGMQENERIAFMAAESRPSQGESSRSPLDTRREEFERGAGGDHDLPYEFTLPTSMPQVLAWVKLLRRVRHGGLQLEVVAFGVGSGTGDAQVVSRFATRVSKQQEVKLP